MPLDVPPDTTLSGEEFFRTEGAYTSLGAPVPGGQVARWILREGPHTAWDIASHMRWSRPWDDIAGFMRRAAVGEAVSHLRALEFDGVVTVEDGEPALWSLSDQAVSA